MNIRDPTSTKVTAKILRNPVVDLWFWEGVERLDQGVEAGKAVGGRLREAAHDEVRQGPRQAGGAVDRGDGRRVQVVLDPALGVVGRRGKEKAPGGRVVHRRAQRVDVGAG